jgi:dephospho-CoA kinase
MPSSSAPHFSRRRPKATPVILAIVGMSGTGKSEATKYLARHCGLTSFYMGGVVLKEVARRGLAGSPQNERKVREQLRRRWGMAAIAKLALPSLREFFKSEDQVLLDGLYSAEELTFLRGFPEEFSVVLIALHSDRHLRYDRLRTRSVRPLTAAEVDLRDEAELQKLNKAIPIVLADFHVCNNQSTRSLHRSLRQVMATLRAVSRSKKKPPE